MGALWIAFSCKTFRVLASTRPGVLVEMPLSASRGRPAGLAVSILQLLGIERLNWDCDSATRTVTRSRESHKLTQPQTRFDKSTALVETKQEAVQH